MVCGSSLAESNAFSMKFQPVERAPGDNGEPSLGLDAERVALPEQPVAKDLALQAPLAVGCGIFPFAFRVIVDVIRRSINNLFRWDQTWIVEVRRDCQVMGALPLHLKIPLRAPFVVIVSNPC